MLLHITFKDDNSFVHYTDALEPNVDILSKFVADGRSIQSAILVDIDGSEIVLPLEAIDGEPIGPHFIALETEYKRVLALSFPALICNRGHMDSINLRINQSIQTLENLKRKSKRFQEKAADLLNRMDRIQKKIEKLKNSNRSTSN